MAHLKKVNRWYRICIPDPDNPGHEKRLSLKTKDDKLANDILKDYNAAERLDLIGLARKSKQQNPPLADLFNEFLAYSKDHKHPNTHLHNKIYIDNFLMPTFGHVRVMDLSDNHVEQFVGKLKNWTTIDEHGKTVPDPYHPETINKRLKCLRQVLKRAARPGGVISKIPVDISAHILRVPKALPKYVTPEQFAIWLAHVNKPTNKWRAVIELCTSIPDSELARLTWALNYNEYAHTIRYWRGKTKREIVVSLNAWAREAMVELKKLVDGPYIFHGIKEVRKAYEVASVNSKIKVTPHMLRHSFATWALSAGETIQKIRDTMGHADISTTQIYARVMPQFAADTTNAIDRMRPPSTLLETSKKTPPRYKNGTREKQKEPAKI